MALIAVHGRTLQCARNGPADWDAIAAVVQLASPTVPVLSNGNVALPRDIDPALSTTLAIGINI